MKPGTINRGVVWLRHAMRRFGIEGVHDFQKRAESEA